MERLKRQLGRAPSREPSDKPEAKRQAGQGDKPGAERQGEGFDEVRALEAGVLGGSEADRATASTRGPNLPGSGSKRLGRSETPYFSGGGAVKEPRGRRPGRSSKGFGRSETPYFSGGGAVREPRGRCPRRSSKGFGRSETPYFLRWRGCKKAAREPPRKRFGALSFQRLCCVGE